MPPLRPIFYLRKKRFHNQELIFQSLYKAQNLGFYKSIYEDGLIERYSETVTKADIYSSAGGFRSALRELGGVTGHWNRVGVPAACNTQLALAAPSNLTALALIAEAHVQGWSLVIEDCPFSKRFLQPLARRDGRRTEFKPFSLIPGKIRSSAGATRFAGRIYVTFPDRPFDSIKGSLSVKLLGQNFLLSIAEALLTCACVDRVFRFGRSLVELDHPKGGASTINGEDLRRLTEEQAVTLEEAILAAPIEYLGWESLYSRSQMYFDLVNANRRNVFQCLLRHSQLHGFPLPPASYCDFVAQLDRRNLKALA